MTSTLTDGGTEDDSEKRIETIREDVRSGRPEKSLASGPVDPYDLRESTREALKGAHEKRPEIWTKVMEVNGFRWYPPSELTKRIGPEKIIPSEIEGATNTSLYWERPHRVGQWRNDLHNPKMPAPIKTSFTVEDLFGLFTDPESFDVWYKDRLTRFAAAVLGVDVPKPKTIRKMSPNARVITGRR